MEALTEKVAGKSHTGKKNEIGNAELLYRISKAMAAVKDGRELLKIIVNETQPVFGFYDIGLTVLDKSGGFYVDWSVFYEEINPSELNQIQRANKTFKFSVDEPLVKYSFARAEKEGKPFIENMTAEFIEKFKDFPHLPLEIAYGYKQFLVTTLKFGGETLGLFNFNGLRENHFETCDLELFQAIADLVAVAVANIKANEEIMEREAEKSVLLAVTEQIAVIRDKNDLFRIIAEKLKPIFGFDEAATVLFDKDFQYTQSIKGVNSIIREDDELSRQMLKEKISLKNSPYKDIIYSNSPKIIKIESVAKRYPDFIGVKIVRKYGFREFVAMPLRYAGKLLGVFEIYSLTEGKFQPSQSQIYAHLADQIAVAIANILANEEIENQLEEIRVLKKRLEAENKYLTEEVRKNYNFEEIIGTSPRLVQVFEAIETVAPTDATVLIQGETGTGKELIARAIHNRSARNERPLIKINCATLPRELVESELFGHERGSFTGASEKRLGKFEIASGGTIFLDEIGELPLEMQVKLLRVLQEREIERLGGKGVIKLDLRVVAATNRNLAQEVQAGRFRADLYYRLCTVELFMPPLRERLEDIEPLTMYFARKYAAKFSRRIERISTQMLEELNAYDFSGNIRELEHIVEHAVIFSKNETLMLPRSLVANGTKTNNLRAITISDSSSVPPKKVADKTETLASIEREHILTVLRQTDGRIKGKGGAAEILGLNPATVYFRMKKLGIKKK